MFDVVRTVYNTALINALTLGNEYNVLENTTLNEKFNVVCNKIEEENPKIQYYTLGMKYEDMLTDDGLSLDNVKHSPLDGSVYKPLPFIIRLLSNDLSVEERAPYRLRVEKLINGAMHAVYYGKKLNFDTIEDMVVKVTNSNGTLLPEELDTTDNETILNPLPYKVDHNFTPDYVNFVVSVSKIKIKLSSVELEEIKNAMTVLYPDDDPVIGEIGIVSGCDVDLGGVSEVADAQVNYFIKMNYDLTTINDNDVVLKTIDLGGLEPLAIHTPI
jgi:hypothetical protein